MFIPHFVQNELDASDIDLAKRLSAFNFCNPFDHILPFADGNVGAADRAHLWGLYIGIVTNRISAFNWCNPFDFILPFPDGAIDAGDRAHLWGMYAGILPGAPAKGAFKPVFRSRRR